MVLTKEDIICIITALNFFKDDEAKGKLIEEINDVISYFKNVYKKL